MPQQYTYPGVYVEEIPSGVHTITGVATSVAAFIDFFKEGPMDEAVRIQSMADFNRIFGGLDTRSAASYAISQFFQNGGTEAYIVRTAKADGTTKLETASLTAKNSSANILEIKAASAGIWGNSLRVDIDYNTADPSTQFNLTVLRYDSSDNDAQPLKSEQYLNLTMDDEAARYAVNVINDGSTLIKVKRGHSVSTDKSLPAPTGLMSGDVGTLAQAVLDGLSAKKFKIQIGTAAAKDAQFETWSANDVKTLSQLKKKIQKAIRSADTSSAFTEATVEWVASGSKNYFRILSGRKASTYSPTELVTISNFSATDKSAETLKLTAGTTGLTSNVQQYKVGHNATVAFQLVGKVGSDGELPTATEIIGSRDSEPYTGMYALENADLFNILCIPLAANIGETNATSMQSIYSKALTYAAERRAFLIIDIPANVTTVEDMEEWLEDNASLRSKDSAVYFPRLQMPDPLNEYRLKSVGPSGTMAGMYSRIDSTRGVWKAPAGTEAVLRGVSALDTELTDAQNGTLNPLAANCFRTFPIYGGVSWGARTLDGSDQAGSEWKYIPIRRLALFLEESLFRGTKWVVFEPNDEPLWAKIRLNIGAFMKSLHKQGAFQGATPEEAYYVKCDGESTTQDDRNKGIVNIEIGFAPLKPAEFVVLKFQQIAGEL